MNDLFNSILIVFAGIFILMNCWDTYKNKMVHGVTTISAFYFTCLTIWNTYFYYSLDQLYSSCSGLFFSITQITWFILIIYYKYISK
jgi:hypothetical protein